jgi:predicted GTPase
VFVNDPRLVTRDYGYWVENELPLAFELQGVPSRSTSKRLAK